MSSCGVATDWTVNALLNQFVCMSEVVVLMIVLTAELAVASSRKIILTVATIEPEVAVTATVSALVN